MMQKYYIYILYSKKSERFYTGASSDINARLERHNAGSTKSTKGGRPWEIVYSEEFNTNTEALNRERYIKYRFLITNTILFYVLIPQEDHH